MKNHRGMICFALLLWMAPLAQAGQEDDPEHLPYWESEQDLDAAREAGEISEELSDELKVLLDNPLDLNLARADELKVLPGVGAEEARRIVEEREENGDYGQAKDLLDRNALPLEAYQKIRLFVTAAPRTSWLKITGELRQEMDTSSYDASRTDESVSSLNARTRIKGMDSAARFRAGGTFLTDHRTLSQGFTPEKNLKIVSVRDSRWVKAYAGYDPARGSGGFAAIPFLKQFYAGNFRAGFYDGIAREMPARFLPDERMSEPGSIEIHPEKRRAVSLRGAAAQVSLLSAKISAFHSANDYPTVVPLSVDASSAVVDDALRLEISGAHAALPLFSASEIEAFWQDQRSERRVTARPEPALRQQVVGAGAKQEFDDANLRVMFSRMDPALTVRSQNADWDDANFYFARGEYGPPSGPSLTASYKKLGRAYYNPAGSLFTGNYLWQFAARIHQDLGDIARLRVEYSESERIVSDLAVRRQEAAFYVHWELGPNVRLQWGERYRSPGPMSISKSFTDDGMLKSVRLEAPDELRSSIRLTHRPGRKVETRFGYDMLARKQENETRITAGQYITTSVRYKALDELEILGQADFNDPDDASSNNETQYWTMELRSSPVKNIDVLLRWKNRYRLRMENVDGTKMEEDRGDSEDRFSLKVIAHW